MSTPKQIIELLERYGHNRDAYLSSEYNETQLRREFIDPFFEALGWDVTNKAGYAEPYKDVVHEYTLKLGDTAKAPDYCLRIGGVRKFFVETKKPSVDISSDSAPAFQLRRYAWSAKLPLSILTNFEEFAVYDTRIKPVKTDKPSVARTIFMKYREYAEQWEETASIFSRDAILKGSFDKYVESSKLKKGTAEVDKAFLDEIEKWRDALARNISIRNPGLSQLELNFAVQRAVDRIIFLRICEDRGIEMYGALMALLGGKNIYKRLFELFNNADDKYNSGLFHFRLEKDRAEEPDRLTPNLEIDDTVLKDIIQNLYYPDSPYEFSVLSADILGQVYEQFLGKVIRLTPAHRAVVEDKPEVKKAGGVYYTPTYIVEYIVENTVGKILGGSRETNGLPDTRKGISPRQASKIRILDPACGSGSFLIGAYQYLLDWHRDWYFADGPEKHRKEIYQVEGDKWLLTTAEKKRILLNNIFGVDIDPQAVEVTKLSLLLKVLEGETEETIRKQLSLYHERALPDLGNNIKCGNSLIGPDFYNNHQMSLLDDEDKYRVNVFDWNAEFPQIMKSGGFNVVMGNPPYVRVDTLPELEKAYFKAHYKSPVGKYDIYYLFIEKGLSLLQNNCQYGMIVPNKFCTSDSGKILRNLIIDTSIYIKLNSVSKLHVFGKVHNYPVIICVQKNKEEKLKKVIFSESINKNGIKESPIRYILKGSDLGKIPEKIFPINVSMSELKLYFQLNKKCDKLIKYLKISEGLRIPSNLEKKKGQNHIIKQYQFSRYGIIKEGSYISEKDRSRILSASADRYINSLKEKIIVAEDALQIEAALDKSGSLCQGGVYFAILTPTSENNFDLCFFLGVLNSALLSRIYKTIYSGMHMGGGYLRFRTKFLEHLPIPKIHISNPTDKTRHDRMVVLVERMLELNKRLAVSKVEHERTTLKRQIDATDKQIDQLVYELYGLNDEEICLVEENRE